MRRRSWQHMSVMLASLASACVGTSTGNPAEDPKIPNVGETGGGACDETKTKLASLDADSPLGFSAADILALAQAHLETSIEWLDRGGVTYGPESGTGTLTLGIAPRAGSEPRFVDRRPKSSGNSGGREIATIGSAEAGSACADVVELDVAVTLATSGGAFDERFDATLSAKSSDVARMYVSRKAADLEGTFEAHLDSDATAELESVQLDLTFSKLGQSGQLGVGLKQPPAGSGGANSGATSSAVNPGSIARWPAGATCGSDPISGTAFAARVDQAVDQFSARDGVDRFNATKLTLTAAGSAATKLTAMFTPVESACAVLEPSDFGPAQSLPSISVSGELQVRSDDGKIDGKWPMQLQAAAAADGSLGVVKVAYDLHGSLIASLVDAPAFESTYGVHGFDMSGYDQAGVLLTLSVGPDAAVSGELIVQGVTRPACQTQPVPAPTPGNGSGSGQSTPGCAGLQFTQVWTAAVTGSN